MKLGRICQTVGGRLTPRLVVACPEQKQVLDLARAEYLRLRQSGATDQRAHRLAATVFPESMSEAIGAGPFFLEEAQRCLEASPEEAILDISTVTWLPPVDPPIMRDCLAFEGHLRNAFEKGQNRPIPDVYYQQPIYYKGNPFTCVGHESVVPWPDTTFMDYELEVGFVIGREGCNLTPETATSHLFGTTILNDFSARDLQRKEGIGGLGPAKGKDFATGLGPWIVTADELNPLACTMIARINGNEWSRGSTADLMWTVEEIIAYISTNETIQPGEVIGSGTVHNGCGRELRRHLEPGDIVELEVEGIGILRNMIGSPQAPAWRPTPRLIPSEKKK